MNMKRSILIMSAVLALCASSIFAGYRIQYFVGYGVYSPYSADTSNTTPGTGLLADNGCGYTLVQLIWAGPDGICNMPVLSNVAGGYAGDDDVVLESRIIQSGISGNLPGFSGYDEWLYTSQLPSPYTTTNTLYSPVYMRIFEDPTLGHADHWRDSALFYPEDIDISNPITIPFADVFNFESGNTYPETGVYLDMGSLTPGNDPETSPLPAVESVSFESNAPASRFSLPTNYSLSAIHGADTLLPSGVWNWQQLEEGTDYTVSNSVVTLVTTNESGPRKRVATFQLQYTP